MNSVRLNVWLVGEHNQTTKHKNTPPTLDGLVVLGHAYGPDAIVVGHSHERQPWMCGRPSDVRKASKASDNHYEGRWILSVIELTVGLAAYPVSTHPNLLYGVIQMGSFRLIHWVVVPV